MTRLSTAVTLDGWKAALVDEVLFRTAWNLSSRGEPDGTRSVQTELVVHVSVASDGGLLLRFDSFVDGEVTTSLMPPF